MEVFSKHLTHLDSERGKIWDCSAQHKNFNSSSDEGADLSEQGKKDQSLPAFNACTTERRFISLR